MLAWCVAMYAEILEEAIGNYLGWEVYKHQ